MKPKSSEGKKDYKKLCKHDDCESTKLFACCICKKIRKPYTGIHINT